MNPKGNPKIAEYGKKFSSDCQATVEAGRKGGLQRAENEAEKKTMQAWSVILGQLPLDILKDSAKMEAICDMMKESGIKNPTFKAGIVASMYKEAMDGNVQAFRSLGDLDGEFKQNVNVEVSTPDDVMASIMKDVKK